LGSASVKGDGPAPAENDKDVLIEKEKTAVGRVGGLETIKASQN